MPLILDRKQVLELYAEAEECKWVLPTFNSENLTTTEVIFSFTKDYEDKTKTDDLPIIIGITNNYKPRPQSVFYTHTRQWKIGMQLFLIELEILTAKGSPYEKLKVMINLDHIQWDDDLELLSWDMDKFSSIMYDAPTLSLDQNIEKTAVFMGKNADKIIIEGACDIIGKTPEEDGGLTSPEDAYRYLSETGVDIIVANLGTEHRASTAEFRFGSDLEKKNTQRLGKGCLCLHGTSSVAVDSLGTLFDDGIRKVNIWTAIDENGKTLCHAMISSDTRAEPYVQSWTKQFGEEKLYQITGHTSHPIFTVFKLLWLKDNKQKVWKNTNKFLCFEDLLQFRLGLDPVIGYSLAGRTMMFDVRKHEWSSEILYSLNITQKQLARPLTSGSVVGNLSYEICQELGFSDNTFVVTGGHDQTCSALGSGITKSGLAMYATGTVECITSTFNKPVFSNNLYKNNLCTYDHAVDGMYATIAYNLTGGNILKWFRDAFGDKEITKSLKTGIDAYQLLLNEAGKKPSNLLVLPYFTSSGTPYFDTNIKGAILGLRLNTKRGEIIRALLEGIAFEMRLNVEILENSGCKITELRVVGGGAKSEIWTQLKADIMGKKITTLNVTEAGCLGVAVLACSAHTGKTIQNLASEWVCPIKTLSPIKENTKWYNKQFEQYKKLYALIKQVEI